MPVKIPVNLVPRAYVNYDAEQRQILGQPLVLSDGFRIPPLTAARLIALELITADFFLHPHSCALIDTAAAAVLVFCDRVLVQDLTASASEPSDSIEDQSSSASEAERTAQVEAPPPQRGLSAYPNLYLAANSFLHAHGDALVVDRDRLVEWILDVPFYGFAMRPSGGGRAKEFWFDGEFVGSVIAPAAKLLAMPFDRVLWEIPLCTIGHALAQQDSALGVKGIERPPDRAMLKSMMKEAAERESRGELHPWQYADPLTYGLTDAQAQANPALIELFSRMRAEYERNGHKPLDPADFPPPSGGPSATNQDIFL